MGLAYVGNFLIDAVKVIAVLGFLIFIHELGHFAVAKWANIKVHEFALGFGKKLFSFVKGETTYSIRLIPMGGFVKMEGEEQASDDERAFNKKPILARFAVVFAGPLMNIILAIIILCAFVMYSGLYVSNQIKNVLPNSGAQIAGVKPGDKVLSIDGRNIRIWDDVNWYMMQQGKSNVNISILRNGNIMYLNVPTTMSLNFSTNSINQITNIKPESGLEKLGLKTGQVIKKINSTAVSNPAELEKAIRNQTTKIITLSVESKNRLVDKPFDANLLRRYYMGIEPFPKAGSFAELVRYSFWKSMFLIKIMVMGVYDLATGNVSLNQVMGPVGIISEISSQKMISDLLWFAAIISLNLGIINLVPFPPLDGGKILTLSIEAVRRKPIKPENEAAISMVGFSLLILLMIIVTYNDILRKISGG